MLGSTGPYEVWFIPSHEAAQQIGRMYRGASADWCISTENPEYFYRSYADSEFVFMVRSDGEGDTTNNKLALQISGYGADAKLTDIWNAEDDRITGDVDADVRPLVDDALDMFRKSGLSRRKYQLECIDKMLSNREWVRNKLFAAANHATPGKNGSYSAVFYIDEVLDVIDDKGDVDSEAVKMIFEGDYFKVFQAPPEPSFEYMNKAEKAFDAVAGEYGVKWGDLEKVYAGHVPDGMDDEVYAWIEDHLDNDFFEGRGYYSEWSDCWVNGTGAEALDDIVSQLQDEIGLLSYSYDKGAQRLAFTCEFSKDQLRDMARLRTSGFTDNALRLSRYDCEYDENEPDFEGVQVESPYYGWSGFDEKAMAEAATDFARRLVGFITMQKDAFGQTYFDFDKPDNPENVK